MINRDKFNNNISKLTEIAERYKSTGALLSADELYDSTEKYDIKVLVVGAFNAGKSSLINRLIERSDFLKEQQSPSTAVATEIHYSEDEAYYGILSDGSHMQLDISEINDVKDFSYAQFYINAPALERFSDYTIVDTPGFDSNVDSHNAALSAYLNKAAAYLLVIDAEDGVINKSAMAFLNEISKYSNDIAILINKSDKKTPSDIELIKSSVQDTLGFAGFDYPVECVSKYDDDLSEKVFKLLDGFGVQRMYDRMIKQRLSIAARGLAGELYSLQQTASVSTYDYDVKISRCDIEIKQISETFAVKRTELEENVSRFTDEIINEIRSKLLGKTDSLTQAALYRSEPAMKAIIAETVRSVINEKLNEFSSSELDIMLNTLDFSGISDYETSTSLTETVTSLAKNTKQLIDSGVFNIYDDSKKEDKLKKGKDVFQKVSGLLFIATDFIAPWLELCIVLLPDIIEFFVKLFGESNKEKLSRQIECVIIPQVTERIYDTVSKAVKKSCAQIISATESNINEAIAAKKTLLNRSKELKAHDLNNYNELISNISKDIPVLIEIADGKDN